MTPDGNHGGATQDETISAFFAFKKTPMPMEPRSASKLGECGLLLNESDYVAGNMSINQIDVTSTLAYMLGIPTPFNNLGTVIPNIAARFNSGANEGKLLGELVELRLANARQKLRYIQEVQRAFEKFTDEEVIEFVNRVELITKAGEQILSKEHDCEGIRHFADLHAKFDQRVLQVIRMKWNAFDEISMTMGNLSLLCSFILVVSLYMITEMRWPLVKLPLGTLLDQYRAEIYLWLILAMLGFSVIYFTGSSADWILICLLGPLLVIVANNFIDALQIFGRKLSSLQYVNRVTFALVLAAFIFFGFTASAVSFLRNQGSSRRC
jgi:hypothetical protein